MSTTSPARELPTWLLVLVPVGGWILISAIDTMLWIDNNPPKPGVHTLIACGLLALTGLSVYLSHRQEARRNRQEERRHQEAAIQQVIAYVSRESANLQRLICQAYAERDTPTEPILRVVGTAAVVPQRAPEPAPAEVLEMPSASTVAAMRRLAAKVVQTD